MTPPRTAAPEPATRLEPLPASLLVVFAGDDNDDDEDDAETSRLASTLRTPLGRKQEASSNHATNLDPTPPKDIE
jgi:hypothetical protein